MIRTWLDSDLGRSGLQVVEPGAAGHDGKHLAQELQPQITQSQPPSLLPVPGSRPGFTSLQLTSVTLTVVHGVERRTHPHPNPDDRLRTLC